MQMLPVFEQQTQSQGSLSAAARVTSVVQTLLSKEDIFFSCNLALPHIIDPILGVESSVLACFVEIV